MGQAGMQGQPCWLHHKTRPRYQIKQRHVVKHIH